MTLAEQITERVYMYIVGNYQEAMKSSIQQIVEDAIVAHTHEYVEETKRATELSNTILGIVKGITDDYKQKHHLTP